MLESMLQSREFVIALVSALKMDMKLLEAVTTSGSWRGRYAQKLWKTWNGTGALCHWCLGWWLCTEQGQTQVSQNQAGVVVSLTEVLSAEDSCVC